MADVLQIAELSAWPGLVHGFSTLALGSMRAGGDGRWLTPERRRFARRLGLEPERLTVAGAVHGTAVARVDEPTGVIRGVDVLITDRPNLPLLLTFADCYPIVLLDPRRPALAVAHAGWRGTASGVAPAAVAALERAYGSRPDDLLAGLGPGICGRCYLVGAEVAERFDPACVRPEGDRYHLDLAAANRRQLEAAGLAPDRIYELGMCTRERPELPSHRRRPDGSRGACIAALQAGPDDWGPR
ncbi:MAG TPA: polyphenol oxidase family protein [Candidatus Dormibacteraeota bacterium]|nr:polyphenol oxidase family protein [Candidatus Dormibacteraeota bacterium]